MTAMQTHLMQCAAYGLSTDWLTPHPFNLYSNAGSTHTSIFPNTTAGDNAKHVHSTSLFDHGLFWVELVLLNHCMVLQLNFRVLANFLWLTPFLFRATIIFSDPQRVLCHEVACWTSSDQYESESDNTKFNTPSPCPHPSHMTPGR